MSIHEKLSDREIEILQLLADGAADKEIAAKLHLSLNTVKWHNRQIYAKLGVTNRAQAARTAEELGLLSGGTAWEIPTSRIPSNLPAPVSSFVGREKEIAEIMDLLQDHRLVTLTGPGGVGKTRLALEMARSLLAAARFTDGVYFVELAPVSDPTRLGDAILDTLGLKTEVGHDAKERLSLFLEGRILLLILDNFEHLLEGAPLVTELLKESPNLQVLATSREALHLYGDQSFIVPTLEIDPSRELFIQRAREVQPSFEPASAEITVIDHICARLDGLPLAIELAAARLPLFSLPALLESLEDRFQVLTAGPRDAPDRHRTLWDAIDWSYQLLSEEERILFRRLAVFQGSRTIDAVQVVCCFDLELPALNGLASMLEKNLIRQEEGLDEEARFYLLETLHDYAHELLAASGEMESIQRRHAEYFVELVAAPRGVILDGPVIRRIAADFANIRLAHDWTKSRNKDLMRLQINVGLLGYWPIMGHENEGMEWVESALKIVESAPLDLQAGTYRSAAGFYLIPKQVELAKYYYHLALECYHELGDRQGIGACHMFLILACVWGGTTDEKQIMEHFRIAEEMFLKTEDISALSTVWEILGGYYQAVGQDELAYQARKKSLSFALESGDLVRIWMSSGEFAHGELERGEPLSAIKTYQDIFRNELDYFKGSSRFEDTLIALAKAEFIYGRTRRAVILLGISNSFIKEKPGNILYANTETQIRNLLDSCAQVLDEVVYQEAWERGQSMGYEDVVAFVLEEGGTSK